ncbi:MAG: hypothetical protein IJB11_02685 [Oscillospiraceae bacterium]|nr:hypothetical protein [Oscillospiraceae bacterium]
MKKGAVAVLILLAMMLGGCADLYDGSYSTVMPHMRPVAPAPQQMMSARNRLQLLDIIQTLIESGKPDGVISVEGYDPQLLEQDMQGICGTIKKSHPVSAYALDQLTYETGKKDGGAVLSVNIRYIRNNTEILSVRSVADMDSASNQIRNAVARCDATLVMEIGKYAERDLLQIVDEYALNNPQMVMEVPQITWKTYPNSGDARVLEVFFTYQTSRESMKSMQERVSRVFESASLYVNGDAQEQEKYMQLYSFLMERYDYQYDTSITPVYSLLSHGVGDSRAFASVYAAMCRQADLECIVVSGAKDGQSRYWNIICRDGVYYHVDLLSDNYAERTDEQMHGYVWDYSAYPVCSDAPVTREPRQ